MVLKISARQARGLQLMVHLGAISALVWLGWAIPSGWLGGDPVPGIIHWLGKGALNLLLLCLCVSPLAKGLKAGGLMRLRRPLGLWALAYASLHLASWLLLDLQLDWALIAGELVKRSYIVVGMGVWGILLVLGITSLPRLVRAMGPRWQRLHNWVYLALLLAPVHYWWSVKSGWVEPLIYLLLALGLLGLRQRKLLRGWALPTRAIRRCPSPDRQ
ncbi:sulfite oxidase heme-binding subunit YedZ [Aeromonas schubertii]|uniref:Protein-methionine-sulfoxide reductase heme-binding subunit MsrQ n=1 Tax=Aeromonas schubertii TaxID=652 RepID=A0A0S2SIR5_9GAMM|nr:protein-methionine-sulfoxide reductase heme-binding subunit MsrQ [Aeromonas schubertii]ALP41570.1 hypothetical protein WL1483_2151 [Aeromonas schubertii]KUE79624.1 sulfoxide reductase heme-binding subunit YedZ [Aeromonas schubertii]MBZ6065346.1 sulfoxide reductase heme-binding subunit YedZ [Aeromonas schubertii]